MYVKHGPVVFWGGEDVVVEVLELALCGKTPVDGVTVAGVLAKG